MSLEFGFDCETLQTEDQTDDENYIPPAENELKKQQTVQEEHHETMQFVDARFHKEKPIISDISTQPSRSMQYTLSTEKPLTITSSFFNEDDETTDNDALPQTHTSTHTSQWSLANEEEILDENEHKSAKSPSFSPLHIGVSNFPQMDFPKWVRDVNSMFLDPEKLVGCPGVDIVVPISDEISGEEYNYEECGLGLDQKILPFDFEKPLIWKREYHIQPIQIELKYDFSDSDGQQSDSSDDIYSSQDQSDSSDYSSDSHGDADMECCEIEYEDGSDVDRYFGFTEHAQTSFKCESSKGKRFLSTLIPKTYDIILMESSPLRVYGNGVNKESLEYLHCALLDQSQLFEKVWQTLLRNSFNVRCANLNGNLENIKRITAEDGCKILQFVGHCCNPIEVLRYQSINNNVQNKIYLDLMKHISEPLDEDYVLLECDKSKGAIDGEWIPISELQTYFNANMNDMVIVLSPNHEKMGKIFLDMGYSYIIAIKAFEQNNQNTQNNWQILDFLHHFYSAILNQECLSRAFELAKTASKSGVNDLKSEREMSKIVRKLEKLEENLTISPCEVSASEMKEYEGVIFDEIDTCFLLLSQENHKQPSSDVFVVFGNDLKRGEPINVCNIKYKSNWNNIIMKPFIGRAKEVCDLYESLCNNKMILVGGRENDGRKSIIKRLISYLYTHNYFEDGLFVLDCKSELIHKRKHWKFMDILCFKLTQLGYDTQKNSIINNNKSELDALHGNNRLFSKGIIMKQTSPIHLKSTISQPFTYMKSMDTESLLPYTPSMGDMLKAIEEYNICFVLFNVDCWDNDEVYHFMDQFASQNKNDRSPCIFTMEYGKHSEYYVQRNKSKSHKKPQKISIPTTVSASLKPAQSKLVTDVSECNAPIQFGKSVVVTVQKPKMSRNDSFLKVFKAKKHYQFEIIKVSPLNKSDITELFLQLCYYKFEKTEIATSAGLHALFDGKPGNVKRVAAFYQFLWRTQDCEESEINLNEIVSKLQTITYKGWISEFHKTVPKMVKIFKDRSRMVNGRGNKLPQIRHIHSQHRSISMYGSMPQSPDNIVIGLSKRVPNLKNRKITSTIMENHTNDDTLSIIKSAQTLNDLQPILSGMQFMDLKRILIQHFGASNSPILTPKHMNGLNTLSEVSNECDSLLSKSQSISQHSSNSSGDRDLSHVQSMSKESPIIEESDTDELISIDIDAKPEYNEYIRNGYVSNVWNGVCEKQSNKKYAKLTDVFVGTLSKHFYDITQLKQVRFTKEMILDWFVYCTNKNYKCENDLIFYESFETFWKWFISASHIVSDLYDITQYEQYHFLDIFYGIQQICDFGFQQQSIGTFLLLLGSECNELLILYINKLRVMEQLSLVRNNCKYITKDDNEPHNIFQFIHDNNDLKQMFSPNINGVITVIEKKSVFNQ